MPPHITDFISCNIVHCLWPATVLISYVHKFYFIGVNLMQKASLKNKEDYWCGGIRISSEGNHSSVFKEPIGKTEHFEHLNSSLAAIYM